MTSPMSFYRKYRPTKIEELDLENIRASMFALSRNLENLPHAFLFSGPRGSGKTSSARILAKLVNCEKPVATGEFFEPCNNCDSCKLIDSGGSLDVVEIDAASNRGIDDIRSLRENINLSPANSKYKFYIMDEAHMLTTEAANAFLKTLEEPPAHAIFVLATTDPQKLPDTVHSRLTKLNFRKANSEEIKRQLSRVAQAEKLDLSDEVIDLIITKSDGSFRDAVKILESLVTELSDLSLAKVSDLIDQTSKINYAEFLAHVRNKDFENSNILLQKYSEEGGEIKDLIEKLTESFREFLILQDSDLSKTQMLSALNLLLVARENVRKTHLPTLALEMFLAEWCTPVDSSQVTVHSSKLKKKPENIGIKRLDELSWAKILSGVRQKNASIEALLRAAKPKGVEGEVLNIGVYYRFHKERLETMELKRALEEVVEEVLGGPIKINCILEEKEVSVGDNLDESGLTQPREPDIISAAKEIFG